ncbi:ABC transporter permease [Agrobacterium sp. LAD9]|uniref:ABC transporter permease n=1 Tax=Agrobacterium sp. LAD9 TaxID=2055153 RepID=UPI001864440E|nr:ABC transporter permease [Agrobacterium sp. LAD9]
MATVVARIGTGLGAYIIVCFLIFLAVNALPGDVITSVLGQNASPERVESMHVALGLEKPLLVRYADWFVGIVSGNFGVSSVSVAQGQPTQLSETLVEPLRNSAVLAGIGLALFVPASLLLGIMAATAAGSYRDRIIIGASVAIAGIPEFLVGSLLVLIFFTWLDWLPPVAYLLPGDSIFDQPEGLVLPVATLLAPAIAFGVRMVKAMLGEIFDLDYIAMARLNGYSERRILTHHVLRNAAAPLLHALGLVTKFMVGGVVVVESVFALPGIGTSLVSAVSARDVQETSVIAALLAAVYIVLNVVIDIAVMFLNPRLRAE